MTEGNPRRTGSWRSWPAATRRTAVLSTVVALVAVVVLGVSSIVLASRQVTSVVNKEVRATAAVSRVVISQQIADLTALVQSYATRPSLSDGVAGGSAGAGVVQSTLASLAHAVPGISASFIADTRGTSRYTYPLEPAVIGTNFAYRDWFKGLVRSGRPYVSNAIETKEASHALAITVTSYIRAANGRPVGVLGINFGLRSIGSFAASVARAQGIALQVTDRVGTSLTAIGAHGLISLARDPRVRAARAGHIGLLDYTPNAAAPGAGTEELSAFGPVAGTGWVVIASVPKSAAFAGVARLRNAVLAITAVLVVLLVATIRGIAGSDRRRRESDRALQSRDRELARVLESTHEAFLSIDVTGVITSWNSRSEALFGWPASEAVGRNYIDTMTPARLREEYRRNLSGRLAGDASTMVDNRSERVALHRDGHELPLEVSAWTHETGGGSSAFVHDISERIAIQADLEAARDQALQASRLKSEFLANMSHEIRTPMNGVIGMSGLLLNTTLDATQRDYAETVSTSAEALLTVINDVLDFSKIEAGRLDVETVPFDVRSVVEDAGALLAARADENHLELTCRIDPALPVMLQGDPGRLRQVLLNLVGNAVKFTPAGEVNLTARVVGDGGADPIMVELSVRDTGIGMAAATLDHLFDSFTQADSSTSRRYGGTGLGLAISKQLVELMGGTLRVVSEPGVGSTFTASIPFIVGVSAASPVILADLGDVHALVVDDNATNQRVLTELLSGWGCTAAVADGAHQAIALMGEAVDEGCPFAVVLLDLNMPDVDGYGLAAMVRAEPRLAATPMIMLTSSAMSGEAARTSEAGIAAYLTKPVRAGQLRGALEVVVGTAARTGGGASPNQPAALDEPSVATGAPPGELTDVAREPAPSAGPEPLAADSPLVLVVEDDAVNRKVLTAMLASVGYRADVAVNGIAALEALGTTRYAAVLMDCQMPVMDGYETTRELRRSEGARRRTPIIAVTATAMVADRVRCLAAGMDDYITKPLTSDALLTALERWIPNRSVPAIPVAVRAPDDAAGRAGALAPGGPVPAPPALDPEIVGRLERLGEDTGTDLVGELTTLFLADAGTRVLAIRDALTTHDTDEIGRSAHALNGASANLGATSLAALCADLETASAAGDLVATKRQFALCETELERVSLALGSVAARS